MNILLTGASGMIGAALLERLLVRGNAVTCIARRPWQRDLNESDVMWVQHDLRYRIPENKLGSTNFDAVFHLAAQTSTYRAKNDPIADLEVNVNGLLNLLEYFRHQKQSPFVVIAGTATEVGITESLPIHEGLPDNPITFYDISKLTAERYLLQYVREGWIGGCCLRFANVYGRHKGTQQADRGILDKVFALATTGQKITIFGDGSYLRDYIFIDDVVSALELAPDFQSETNGRVFNIGTGVGTSLRMAFESVGALANSITGMTVEYQSVAAPAALSAIEFRNAVIDSSAYRNATGWLPKFDLASGLQAAYRP
jgi:nucleoside-diphosphate-sugar epimerase